MPENAARPSPEHLDHLLPALASTRPGQLWLLISPVRILEIERQLIPYLALQSPVHVIVGGQPYDVDGVMRGLRKLTPEAPRLRERIRQRRAPTSFQMRALLKNTPETTDPVLVLNFLIRYFDEDDELWKSRYLLEDSIAELHRLSRRAPVVVTARPPLAKHTPYLALFDLLRGMTDRVVEFVAPAQPRQLNLF